MIDHAAERAVLAGIFTYGTKVYDDIEDLISVSTFHLDSNQAIFKCLEHLLKGQDNVKLDYPSIVSAANSLGLSSFFSKSEEQLHLRGIMNMPIKQENVRKLAGKIRKLEIARELSSRHDEAKNTLMKVTGDESIDKIINYSESPTNDYTSQLASTNSEGPKQFGDGFRAYIEFLATTDRSSVGISTGYPEYDLAIGGGLREGTVNVIGARPKMGKAQPLDAIVYTPSGPKKMGELKIGDIVCTPDGTSIIKDIFPQGPLEIYRIKFKTGDFTECCKDHLWKIIDRNKSLIINTEELIKRFNRPKVFIELLDDCFYYHQNIPMNPYLLGALLGDGGFTEHSLNITNINEELLNEIRNSLEDDYKLINTKNSITYRITKGRTGLKNKYIQILKSLGLKGLYSNNKFIPDIYKYNSLDIRYNLLQGLMDTDGHVNDTGTSIEYSTTSLRLAKDVKEVVQSVGGLCSIKSRITKCNNKRFLSYRCLIRHNDISKFVRVSIKKQECVLRTKGKLKRHISSIEMIGVKDAQCIKLEDKRGLYLTDNHIITHNTQHGENVCLYIAGVTGIPVLNCDTEMSKEDHWHRMAANLTGIPVNDIELGRFRESHLKRKVYEALDKIEKMPYDYLSIAGQPFEETIALIRRWLVKRVGLLPNGKAKPHAIIFDYLKLMSTDILESKSIQEYQALGFMMTELHNLMNKYGGRTLAYVQLNRDGVDRESTDVVSQSDRIIWLCSNFSILKKKSDEEMAEQANSKIKYNRKLVQLAARHGAGLDDGDYINMHLNGSIARLIEGPTKFKLSIESRQNVGVIDEQIPFGV